MVCYRISYYFCGFEGMRGTVQYFLQQQQQIPMQQVHHGNHPPQPGQLLNTANIAQEKQ
jgi:hypothetical protein